MSKKTRTTKEKRTEKERLFGILTTGARERYAETAWAALLTAGILCMAGLIAHFLLFPIIGLVFHTEISNLTAVLWKNANGGSIVLRYGRFLQYAFDVLFVAGTGTAVFFVRKAVLRRRRKKEEAKKPRGKVVKEETELFTGENFTVSAERQEKPASPENGAQILISEIRNLLKK